MNESIKNSAIKLHEKNRIISNFCKEESKELAMDVLDRILIDQSLSP